MFTKFIKAEEPNKLSATIYGGEDDGGAEIVQMVIVLGFALGLGAALMAFQTQIAGAIEKTGTQMTTFFTNITAGMTE